MNRDQSRTVTRQTFTAAFDKDRFLNFTRNLVNHIDESKAFSRNSQYVKDAFKDHVQRFERLGTYTSLQNETLDILVVHVTQGSKLERARTALRNFVADHLKQRNDKDAALVAFVSPEEATWRFSYVKMEYATAGKEDGKVGVEAHLTPARRFSYLVGEGESCHTAQTRFLGLLQDTETAPTLARIEEAFSVEAVTKEFFTKYAELFGQIHAALEKLTAQNKTIGEEFKAKGVNTVDFAKKLMGQIVFLYFLQKKGWLGVQKGNDWGSGPRGFLRRLAAGEFGKYENFFNDILEPLFYDTLATDRGHDAWCERFKCRIPFLNGGLFEPPGDYEWRKIDIALPNALFTNSEFVELGVTGTGVLDVFDRYNFTVNEAEPMEKEVAIDPEMLGKVFENLIEENRRKGLGSYYTPREIVHYMCQESLINYLDTAINRRPKALVPAKPKQGKLLGEPDPEQTTLQEAVDEQVVPRADIETFVRLGEQYYFYEAAKQSGTIGRDYPKPPKSIESNARLLDKKLAEITVCDPAVGSGAFPVGMMTEIVRARCALTPYFNDVHERSPYFFKRHAIQNCLYGADIDPGAVEIAKLRLWLSLVVDEEDVKQIKPLPNLDYKVVTGNSLLGFPFKSEGLSHVEDLKGQFFDETNPGRKASLKTQIDEQIRRLLDASEKSLGYRVGFDFNLVFSEVFHRRNGFDVVIGNPPYVRQEQIKELKPRLKQQYNCYTGTADLYVYFYERGVRLLRRGGAFSFITSNKWFRSAYGEKLRDWLARETRLACIIDFGDAPVFEAISYPCIVVLTRDGCESHRSGQPATGEVQALTWQPGLPLEQFAKIFRKDSFALSQTSLKSDGWRLENSTKLKLLERIRSAGTPLGEYVKGRLYYGIKTGFNEAFVIDRATRDRLIAEHASSAEIIKPFLRGRDVKRWRAEPLDMWLIFTRRGINISKYPAIYRRLKAYREQLEPMPDHWDTRKRGLWPGRKPGSYKWYEIQDNIAYWKEFEEPKIVVPAITNAVNYASDDRGFYSNDKTSIIIAPSVPYALAILNSQVSWWLTRQTFASKQGGFYEFKPMYFSQLPIPNATPAQQKSIISLVDKVLAIRQCDPDADVSALEAEIDRHVYALYGLTEEEIAIVHGPEGK